MARAVQTQVLPEDIASVADDTLLRCRHLVDTAQEQYRAGSDIVALATINHLMAQLESCIDNYNICQDHETYEPSENEVSGSSGWKNVWKKFLLLPARRSTTKPENDNVLETARSKLERAVERLSLGMDSLERITALRNVNNPLGSYYRLGGCKRLASKKCQPGFGITGRYEETGDRMFTLVIRLMRIEDTLNEWKTSKTNIVPQKTIGVLKNLHTKLAAVCSDVISFMLSFPFEIEIFDSAMKDLNRNFQSLQILIDSPVKALNGQKALIQDIAAVGKYLTNSESEYELRRQKFDFECSQSPLLARFRALENLGLKAGDLVNTSLVIQCMERTRDHPDGGLGLPIICKGNKIAPKEQHSGGYGIVSQMQLPQNALGVNNTIKETNRLVAVKTMDNKEKTTESLALANLRMLREADRWAAVSSDPRKLAGGGRYLAQILGIWEDFQEERPGLVSLWGKHDLKAHVRDSNLSTLQRLELAYKVAQGALYLHTCKPAIVHGDLKAANVIMVDEEPLLTDFGVAKCLDDVKGFTTGGDSYTDDYRAPEVQYRNTSLVQYPTKESDVYAFGCVLFEILSGKAPFEGFSKETRAEWIRENMDYTPIDADASKDNMSPFPFERAHLELMKWCFNFHASKRPTMEKIVQVLKELQ